MSVQDNTKISVLLVEDSEDDALLIVMELRGGGYKPSFERVESPEDMQSALEEKQWDLIVSDFSLPSFSGLDALKLYKEKGLDIPFIVVSGAIGEETAIGLMHEGAHDYIMKDNLARLVPAVLREIRDAGIRAERRKAAKALEKSEHQYRNLFFSINDVIIVVDSNRNIVDANQPALRNQFGYELDEILSRQTSVLYANADGFERVGTAVSNLQQLSSGKIMEIDFRKKNGETFPAELNAMKLFDEHGGVVGNLGIIRDITERKKSEDSLMASEREYRALSQQFITLLNSIPDPLLLISRDKEILWANSGAAKAFDLKPEGKMNCYNIWHKSDKECRGCPVIRSFESGQEETSIIPTGDERVWDVRAFPIKNDIDEVVNVIELAIDVTERQKLQQKAMLVSQLASLGELAAGVAHEINNPNAAIILNTQLLVDDQDMVSEERADILGRIIGNSERIDRIVSKLDDINHLIDIIFN
ncbi:MAG TPA: PAS domain S-box protein, partial [Nitrospirae bacterium]|nr:PAS domain S-box protein [Nitrospirota bacterium]